MITKEQFKNLKKGDEITNGGLRMIVTVPPYEKGDFIKIHTEHRTKSMTTEYVLDDMDCDDITLHTRVKHSCATCRFHGTYYCNHPHTSNNGNNRCLEIEIRNRIDDIEHGIRKKGRRDPSVQQAREMLKEWKEEITD